MPARSFDGKLIVVDFQFNDLQLRRDRPQRDSTLFLANFGLKMKDRSLQPRRSYSRGRRRVNMRVCARTRFGAESAINLNELCNGCCEIANAGRATRA